MSGFSIAMSENAISNILAEMYNKIVFSPGKYDHSNIHKRGNCNVQTILCLFIGDFYDFF